MRGHFRSRATSYPPLTYSIVNPPAGMTINATTGAVSWTPPASSLGTTNVTFQATNQFGSAQTTVALYVSADVPVPGFVFTNTTSPTLNVVGFPIGLQITDASNTPFDLHGGLGAPQTSPSTRTPGW